MEIVSYVLDGALEHEDSMGTGSVIRPGDVQRMSAGTGVLHSEYNASRTEPVHFLQIWIVPDRAGHAPGYEQKTFGDADKRGRLRLIASPDGADGSVTIHQDARIHTTVLAPGAAVEHAIPPGRHAWVHVARGAAEVNGTPLAAGDAAALSGEPAVGLRGAGDGDAEVLVFDLA
jgi:redox-sensitive bicupin YhaK (pirin superfamily)